MQLKFSFATLLTTVLVAFSAQEAHAAPTVKRANEMATMPLRRMEPRSDVHPHIAHQQLVNRSYRRYARMTGNPAPSDDELHEHLVRRMLEVEGEGLMKRYYRPAVEQKGTLKNVYIQPGTKAPKAAKASKTNNLAAAAGNGLGANAAAALQAAIQAGKDAAAKGASAAEIKQAVVDAFKAALAGQGGAAAAAKGDAAVAAAPADSQADDAAADAAAVDNAAAADANNAAAAGAATDLNGPGFSKLTLDALANPSGVTKAAVAPSANSLGLDIEGPDVGYLAEVKMGTPPRNFLILMDSGSADLWVAAENCASQAGGNCGKHNALGPKSSSTFVDTKAPFAVTYGTGNVKGDIITDNINIAGLKLNKHSFGVATSESVEFSSNAVPFDGLMGLAQSLLSEQKVQTPIESLASNKLVANAIVSYKIPRVGDGKNDGEITFGGLDAAKFDAKTLITTPVVSKIGFWEAAMPDVTVDGKSLGLQGRTAILDTGTTLVIAPPNDALAIHQAIPGAKFDGQQTFTVPCTTSVKLALNFGGKSFDINPQDLAVQPLDPNNLKGDCISGISPGQIGGANQWLVGDVFLKNAYFSTDVGKNTISLAKLV